MENHCDLYFELGNFTILSNAISKNAVPNSIHGKYVHIYIWQILIAIPKNRLLCAFGEDWILTAALQWNLTV